MAPTPHHLYCMKDGVSFLVDNTLFKVPRYMLENTSPVFRTMLYEVQPDSNPIPLHGVSRPDFEKLLTLLYPLTPLLDPLSAPWDENQWTAILRLATMWEMAEIRAAAMRLLSQTRSPFTKINLGREYGHSPWLREGFIILCLRPEPIAANEAIQLTKEDVIACAAAREEIRRVLPSDYKRNPKWVHPSRRIRAKELSPEPTDFEHLAHDRIVREIVNRAFGFEEEEEVKSLELSDSQNEQYDWWPWHINKLQRVLWLTRGHDKEEIRDSIKEAKDVSDAASILTVADIEKHWIRDMIPTDFANHFTPLSSAIILSVCFLILIPHAFT